MAENELKQYKNSKSGRCLPLETNDLTAILNMAIEQSVARKGRPCAYPDNEMGLEIFSQKTIDYFEYINNINQNPDIENKLIPDIENWALFLGITRNSILNYEQRGKEWADTIAYYKNAIASIKKQLSLNYKVPPVIAMFDLVNNHGYVNSSEFKLIQDENEGKRKRVRTEDLPTFEIIEED